MKPITAALIGAGGRGIATFGGYALRYPNEIQFVAVAEPNPERLAHFADQHHITPAQQYTDWTQLLAQPRLADALVIATLDRQHFAPAMQALDLGYDILLEKPISPDPLECLALAKKAESTASLLMICHVLRYTSFFSTIKQALDSGVLGEIVSVVHNENVGYYHQAHSFVRGNWRNSQETSPMILAKSCHDLDILVWLMGKPVKKVSSFGGLYLFKPENAPAGSTARCTDGCAVERQCPYSALRIYIDERNWFGDVIVLDPTNENKLKALRTGPYGRCVYRCDNDVVDHQVVNLEFDGGVTATFNMCAFTHEISRTLKIMGTHGELRANMELSEVEVHDFVHNTRQVIHTASGAGHGGGDEGLLHTFTSLVRSPNALERSNPLTSIHVSVQSHLLAFAAEKSRREQIMVDMEAYTRQLG